MAELAKSHAARLLLCYMAISLALAARGDQLTLHDGRTFTGTVTEDESLVTIETTNASVSFLRSQVARVEYAATPESILKDRLSKLRPSDIKGLAELAGWSAKQPGLQRQSDGLWRDILALDHDHADARRALGYIRLVGKWLDFEQAMELTSSRITSGTIDGSLDDALTGLLPLAHNQAESVRIRELQALLLLRRERFKESADAAGKLAKSASGAAAVRLTAIAEILTEHADGMYVVTGPYPPEAALVGQTSGVLNKGPASLAEPLVLAAALRDKAAEAIATGEKLRDKGIAVEPTQPQSAVNSYLLALRQYDRADALVSDIARNYKIEIARRRIALLRNDADDLAAKFDEEMKALGAQTLSAQAYANKLIRMSRHLTGFRDDMDEILKLAEPYPRDLVLQITWAELDRKKITGMLETLRKELNEAR